MKTVIFQTENAVFEFSQKEVKERLICKHSEHAPGEVTQLLKLISTDTSESLLIPDDHNYFGHVAADLIGSGIGTVSCKICGKIYDTDQLKEFAVGFGGSPFDINQQQKGGIRQFEERKNPSLFGGHGFKCPKDHLLIRMI